VIVRGRSIYATVPFLSMGKTNLESMFSDDDDESTPLCCERRKTNRDCVILSNCNQPTVYLCQLFVTGFAIFISYAFSAFCMECIDTVYESYTGFTLNEAYEDWLLSGTATLPLTLAAAFHRFLEFSRLSLLFVLSLTGKDLLLLETISQMKYLCRLRKKEKQNK